MEELLKQRTIDLTQEQIDSLIEYKTNELNKLLESTPYEVCIFETSELYEDCDEDDEYFKQLMFEAHLQHKETEEEFGEWTGRYCELESVFDEIEVQVDLVLEGVNNVN